MTAEHTHHAPASIPGSTDAPTFVSVALRRAWDGDMGCAEQWLRELKDGNNNDNLRHAPKVLRALAALAEQILFEPLHDKAATTHDLRVDPARVDAVLSYLGEPVPDGVEAYPIAGGTR